MKCKCFLLEQDYLVSKYNTIQVQHQRGSLCIKVADLCGAKSPLQGHQPLKERPPQYSIDLRNKQFFKERAKNKIE